MAIRKIEVPIPMLRASPAGSGRKRKSTRLSPMLARWPQGRRIVASAAFCLCVAVLIVTVFRGMSSSFLVRAAQTLAIAVGAVGLIGLVIATLTGRLANYTDPADEEEFEQLVRRSERLARENLPAQPDEGGV